MRALRLCSCTSRQLRHFITCDRHLDRLAESTSRARSAERNTAAPRPWRSIPQACLETPQVAHVAAWLTRPKRAVSHFIPWDPAAKQHRCQLTGQRRRTSKCLEALQVDSGS